ncbi:MAG: proline--tRNA ligase [Deltaproteobacteria bacterium]|jgi:prolyl-tRNA synthetase|nr:proline--tRNA ligase [Deltaproteobacteria bacterium]
MIMEPNSGRAFPVAPQDAPYETKINSYGEVIGQRLSAYLAPTLKETPAEAEVASHKLMIRAGLIRKLAAGVYSYLPMGLRSLRKVERIIRAEMNRYKAREVLLPAVQPAELWKESGRWEKYGPELLRFKDRHDRDCVIGPTHEEVITDIVRREIRSFRDLPLNLYQIQTKFRDEIRPRFGLMRGREFIMKDAYSFDADEASADVSYRDMYQAYVNIFHNCGLNFAVVEADSGAIGGSYSHEFMVLADTGEDALAFCESCSYAANLEKAELRDYPVFQAAETELTKVRTPGCRHVPQLAAFLKTEEAGIIKSMLFMADDVSPVLVLIPGDRAISLVKLKNFLDGAAPALASPEVAEKIMGVPMGFVTPVGAKVRIVADEGVKRMNAGVVGAGEADYHYTGAKPGRDFDVDAYADLAEVKEADPCPRCGKPLHVRRGIEVGHVFKLGLKYSKAMGALFAKPDGTEAPVVMGCYGIGVGRTVAASIEQNHDSDGIIWPMALAPFHVALLPLQLQNEAVAQATERLYDQLASLGVETLLDDRNERPGLKFKDADLLGLPLRVAVSEKSLAKGQVELKDRRSREVTMLDLETAASALADMVKNSLSG